MASASSRVRYKATNTQTGEVYIGNARELAGKLHVSRATIYGYSATGQPYKAVWMFENEGEEPKSESDYRIPQSLLDEWDKVVKGFRRCRA